MLREFVENKRYLFAEEASGWEEAIRMSTLPLQADGSVDATYAGQIIECVKKYGPYIVIMPGVAMPHSQENASGVKKTAVSFMRLEKPVRFGETDPDQYASLFFTLASCDHNEHIKNMQRLAELLLNEPLMQALAQAQTPETLLQLQEDYLDHQ